MSAHESWTDQLSDYLDDELPDAERVRVEAHLSECADCSAALDALRRVVAGASSLAPHPPEHELWTGIAARIAPPARRFSFTMPQLAAASLLLAALSGSVVWFLAAPGSGPQAVATGASLPEHRTDAAVPPVVVSEPPPYPGGDSGLAPAVSVADAQYDAAVDDLERALEAGRGRLDEATISVVEQNLSIIDRAIAEALAALAADSSNGYLSGHLLEARRRKLDLLRRATALTQSN